MKIAFTGGGTGGHFYPIIAVAERVNRIIDRENILAPKLYYFSSDPFDRELLFQNNLVYEEISAGKMRTHPTLRGIFSNFLDLFRTFFGVLGAIGKMYSIYPDVVFGKGGFASFPAILAARILRIPVFIHESDSAPGRVNRWAGKFAARTAVSFREAVEYFPKEKVAWTGHPVRIEIEHPAPREEALKYFNLESDLPVVFILGGSQGAELINNTILDALPRLTKKYQILHQTGIRNFQNVSAQAKVVFGKDPTKSRYVPLAYLGNLEMKMAAGAADLVVSRAGSTLFEIAAWGLPSVLVPFAESNADHSRKNAYNYAKAGACAVIEEVNMTANILVSEIERTLGDKATLSKMSEAAKNFNQPGAADKIARELIDMALAHEAS
ncbi:MAG: UDP-N-acetylglucosamine--N-acetylmuramyl-(pentapeptide) pyrophosphoryl-undecaprenol N-acetylglucosamine transferase [Patescibacteria group bacterium]